MLLYRNLNCSQMFDIGEKSHKNSTEPRQTQYYDTVLTVQEESNKNRMVLGVQWHFCDIYDLQHWHAY
jgi:hypothetical protein